MSLTLPVLIWLEELTDVRGSSAGEGSRILDRGRGKDIGAGRWQAPKTPGSWDSLMQADPTQSLDERHARGKVT